MNFSLKISKTIIYFRVYQLATYYNLLNITKNYVIIIVIKVEGDKIMGKSIFYCDIEKTFRVDRDNALLSRKERGLQLQDFVNSLDILCEAEGEEEFLFSFVSSNRIDDVINCIKEISPYINNSKHIKFSTSFAENKKIIGEDPSTIKDCRTTKFSQIVNNLRHIQDDVYYEIENAKIDKIFFADDALINHMLVKNILPKYSKEIEIVELQIGNDIDNKSTNEFGVASYGLNAVTESILKYAKANSIIGKFKVEDPETQKFMENLSLSTPETPKTNDTINDNSPTK